MHQWKYFTLNFFIKEIFSVKKFLNYGITQSWVLLSRIALSHSADGCLPSHKGIIKVPSFCLPFLYMLIENWPWLGHTSSYQLLLTTILLTVQLRWYINKSCEMKWPSVTDFTWQQHSKRCQLHHFVSSEYDVGLQNWCGRWQEASNILMILMALNIPVVATSYETAILMQMCRLQIILTHSKILMWSFCSPILYSINVTWRVWKDCGKINMLKCC